MEESSESKDNLRNKRFEQLTRDLMAKNPSFPRTPDKKMDIVAAIENKDVTNYLELIDDNGSDEMLYIIHCLQAIYDELGKEKPDEGFMKDRLEKIVSAHTLFV